MIQFYAPDIEKDGVLPEIESTHCARVLRKKEGDEIYVTDGKGTRFLCRIEKSHPSHTQVSILSHQVFNSERDYYLTLAISPTKNSDRVEWLVEKAVEIGVDKIVLLRCDRSERKTIRADRLIKIMISAMKQSLSVHVPELIDLLPFNEFLEGETEDSQKFFGYCSDEFQRIEFAKECKAGGNISIMIGPEGDFTPDEVKKAIEKGFKPVTFGNKRLRTETAGVYAVCAVNVINQRLK